jgi:hypothetical protein
MAMFSRPETICLFAIFLLASCTNITYDYPANWPKQVVPKEDEACPDVSGVYQLYGITNSELKDDNNFSGCLLHHLYSESTFLNPLKQKPGELNNISPELQKLIDLTACVEIAQPNPEQLEIIVWGRRGNDRYILQRDFLSVANGDFSCDQEGVHLQTRYHFFSAIISNLFAYEQQTLLKAQDKSLLLRYLSRLTVNHTFVPGSSSTSYWIRWEACSSETSE